MTSTSPRLLIIPLLLLAGCSLVLSPSRRVGEPDEDASAVDASMDAPTLDGGADAPALPMDAGLDAPLGVDAGLDAPLADDVFVSPDAFEMADAFEMLDAFEMPDAFASGDVFATPDACIADDVECDGIDADCDGVDDTDELTVAMACPWRRCSLQMGSSRPFCDRAGLVAAGGYHTCVLTAPSQDLWCWGIDSSGQLPGITIPAGAATPVAPTRSSINGIYDLCAYTNGTCFLRESGPPGATVREVGCDGDGPPSAPGMPWSRPVDAVELACGVNHLCVVRRDGGVSCAGRNGNSGIATGQIGRPASDGPGVFVELQDVPLPAGRTARAVSVGTNFSCALLDNGTIVCWGADGNGILGRGPRSTAGVTHVADYVEAPGLSFVGLATTQFAACANTPLDTYCWGDQGDGVTIGQAVAVATTNMPTPAPAMGPFPRTGLVAGMHNMCARVMGGQMSCWGRQTAGEFALVPRDPVVPTFNLPQLALPRAGGMPIATIEMALGYSNGMPGLGGHVCVIAGGDLYCWGSNVAGQVRVPASPRVPDAFLVTP